MESKTKEKLSKYRHYSLALWQTNERRGEGWNLLTKQISNTSLVWYTVSLLVYWSLESVVFKGSSLFVIVHELLLIKYRAKDIPNNTSHLYSLISLICPLFLSVSFKCMHIWFLGCMQNCALGCMQNFALKHTKKVDLICMNNSYFKCMPSWHSGLLSWPSGVLTNAL